jgi:hypothetical protein
VALRAERDGATAGHLPPNVRHAGLHLRAAAGQGSDAQSRRWRASSACQARALVRLRLAVRGLAGDAIPLKETRPVPPSGLGDGRERGPLACRPADSAADHHYEPADIYVLRRLRPPVRRFPASYTRWRHPPFPRRWLSHPDPFGACKLLVTISSHPFCRVSPPGCLRACLGSLCLVASWMIGACRSRGGEPARVQRILRDDVLDSQVSSHNFADPLAATRAIGRCKATDAIPTGTRRRRRISPPFRSYS